jgi:hypothetical protein
MWRSSCWQASFGEALGMHASLGSGCVMETTMMMDKEFFHFLFIYSHSFGIESVPSHSPCFHGPDGQESNSTCFLILVFSV